MFWFSPHCAIIYSMQGLSLQRKTLPCSCSVQNFSSHVPLIAPSAPPTHLAVSRLNSSSHIKLSWLPVPSSHINAPVLLGYIVNYKETGNLTFLTNRTENTWIELYLPNNNTEYLFTVSGYNERGMGPNASLAYFFSSLNASGTGNNSLIGHGSNATNSASGSSNTTLPGKLQDNCYA